MKAAIAGSCCLKEFGSQDSVSLLPSNIPVEYNKGFCQSIVDFRLRGNDDDHVVLQCGGVNHGIIYKKYPAALLFDTLKHHPHEGGGLINNHLKMRDLQNSWIIEGETQISHFLLKHYQAIRTIKS